MISDWCLSFYSSKSIEPWIKRIWLSYEHPVHIQFGLIILWNNRNTFFLNVKWDSTLSFSVLHFHVFLRDCCQILLLILSELKRGNWLLFALMYPQIFWSFQRKKELINSPKTAYYQKQNKKYRTENYYTSFKKWFLLSSDKYYIKFSPE